MPNPVRRCHVATTARPDRQRCAAIASQGDDHAVGFHRRGVRQRSRPATSPKLLAGRWIKGTDAARQRCNQFEVTIDLNQDRRVPGTSQSFTSRFVAAKIVGIAVILGAAESAFGIVIQCVHLPACFASGLVHGDQEFVVPRPEQQDAQIVIQNRRGPVAPHMLLRAKVASPQFIAIDIPANQPGGPKPSDHVFPISDRRRRTIGIGFVRCFRFVVPDAPTPNLATGLSIHAEQTPLVGFRKRLSEKHAVFPHDRGRVARFWQLDPPLYVLVRPPLAHDTIGRGDARSRWSSPLGPIRVGCR